MREAGAVSRALGPFGPLRLSGVPPGRWPLETSAADPAIRCTRRPPGVGGVCPRQAAVRHGVKIGDEALLGKARLGLETKRSRARPASDWGRSTLGRGPPRMGDEALLGEARLAGSPWEPLGWRRRGGAWHCRRVAGTAGGHSWGTSRPQGSHVARRVGNTRGFFDRAGSATIKGTLGQGPRSTAPVSIHAAALRRDAPKAGSPRVWGLYS